MLMRTPNPELGQDAAGRTVARSEAWDNAPAVVLQGLAKAFGTERAVRGIDLSIDKGLFFAILGPSGCGKSTTLRMIAGLEQPDQGRILCGGHVLCDVDRSVHVPSRRRNMGMVFQSYAVWPHLSVFDTIAYPLRIRRRPRDEIAERVAEAVDLVGLAGLEKRRAATLSGGQQQRVALARALVYRPDVLLLDEPFSSLDVKLREQLRVELKLLQRKLRITVVLVTHDQTEALTLADRIAVMRDGLVEQIADPKSVYESPISEFVRDFVGRSTILPGRAVARTAAGALAIELFGRQIVLPREQIRGAIAAGDVVDISIRPENITVIPSSTDTRSDSPGGVSLEGTVRAVMFGGDRTECLIDVSGCEIEAFASRSDAVVENQRILLTLRTDSITAWPASLLTATESR
jgi:ABC-type Fe3+/spermidine/putrescine transport system ATPase subunit